jgi:2-(1,2-epoxy-1,2-dihydrophenyl)acetyl-CoA isomerase
MKNTILLAEDAGVATIVLNRPDQLNAFADDMRERLLDALERVAHGPVRALVITGAGSAFCAGGDVRNMAKLKTRDSGAQDLEKLLDAGARVIRRLSTLPIPTIAAINGAAAGAGMNLALACDLRFASDQASFTESFVRIGLHPNWGGTWFLPRIVGEAKARELCWLGDPVDAAEALRIGLVSRVVPADRLMNETRALARRLADSPATSVRTIKQSILASRWRPLDACLAAEAVAQQICWESPDVSEGLTAFVEKRAPSFRGTLPIASHATGFE